MNAIKPRLAAKRVCGDRLRAPLCSTESQLLSIRLTKNPSNLPSLTGQRSCLVYFHQPDSVRARLMDQ